MLQNFIEVCKRFPYQDKGIFYSEIYLFLQYCNQLGVSLIIESGTYKGFATEIIRASVEHQVYTIDRQKLYSPSGSFLKAPVLVITGESQEIISGILANYPPGNNIAILIDGPKGQAALDLKDQCFMHQAVKLVGIHDLAPGHGESDHSHFQEYREQIGRQLDRLIHTSYAQKYPDGPGLAIWTA